jgi:hypothetical protein
MAIAVPKEKEIDYDKNLKIGIKREGSRFSAYLKGRINGKDVSVETENHGYANVSASVFANSLNEWLLSEYDLILPQETLESKVQEIIRGLKLG